MARSDKTRPGINAENAIPYRCEGSTTWTVAYGDTLTGIAIEVYGNGDKWMYIYNANRGAIHNPDSLQDLVSTQLVVPKITDGNTTSTTAVAGKYAGAKTWVIQYGDTLTGISKAVYGTTKYWTRIYNANSDVIEDPDYIIKLVGYPLEIPSEKDEEEGEEIPPELKKGTGYSKTHNYTLSIQSRNNLFVPAIEDGVTIEWDRGGVPGKIEFTVLKSATNSYWEGDIVKFYVEGRLLFKGYVFSKQRNKEGKIRTVAYDQTRYLKNKFAYVFQDRTASQILRGLCKDFKLKTGRIEDSKFKIPTIAEENSEAFDIILNATEETLANTGQLFTLYDDRGKITYRNVLNMKSKTLIRADTAEDFDYKTSIDEDTYNRIVLYYKPASTGGDTEFEGGKGSFINFGGSFPPWHNQANLYSTHPNGGGYPGQCTWYCGDRLMQLGVKNIPYPMGNGGQWHVAAQGAGIPCYYGKPFPGAIADMYPMHVAFVEKVNSDGSIDCSAFWGSVGDYTLHQEHYTPGQVSNMWFIDFGVRANGGKTATAKPKSSIGVTQTNSRVAVTGTPGQKSVGAGVTRWSSYIIQTATKYNLPADFVAAIIYHESRGQANATSSAGAMGLMQLMPGTAASMGVTNAYDPQQNIEGGCKLLAYLANYGGKKRDPNVILRMYWGGPGAINNASLDSYWEDIKKLLPNEFTGMSGTCSTLNSIENGDNATMQVFIAEDKKSMEKWGILQKFEQVQSDGIGQHKADALLKIHNRKTRTFTVKDALGDITVRGGTMIPVYLNIGDIIVDNYMLVNKVTHHFYRDKYTMDLELEGAYED